MPTISQEFGCRPGTLRERLVKALHRRLGRQVDASYLIVHVYWGANKTGNESSLYMIAQGMRGMIAKRRLPYVVQRGQNMRGAMTLGLHPRPRRGRPRRAP